VQAIYPCERAGQGAGGVGKCEGTACSSAGYGAGAISSAISGG